MKISRILVACLIASMGSAAFAALPRSTVFAVAPSTSFQAVHPTTTALFPILPRWNCHLYFVAHNTPTPF